MGLNELDDEIKRVGDAYYNFTQAPLQGVVTSITDAGFAGVSIDGIDDDLQNVPTLSPASLPIINTTSTLPDGSSISVSVTQNQINLSVGDIVLIAFIQGQIGNPVIVGLISQYDGSL
jgi:hypothetical protein